MLYFYEIEMKSKSKNVKENFKVYRIFCLDLTKFKIIGVLES